MTFGIEYELHACLIIISQVYQLLHSFEELWNELMEERFGDLALENHVVEYSDSALDENFASHFALIFCELHQEIKVKLL